MSSNIDFNFLGYNHDMLVVVDFIFYSACASALFYIYWTWHYFAWSKAGVPAVKPSFPNGNIQDVVKLKKRPEEFNDDLYKRFPGKPFVGFYGRRQPCLMIRSLALANDLLSFNSPRCEYEASETFRKLMTSIDAFIGHLDLYDRLPQPVHDLALRHASNTLLTSLSEWRVESFMNYHHDILSPWYDTETPLSGCALYEFQQTTKPVSETEFDKRSKSLMEVLKGNGVVKKTLRHEEFFISALRKLVPFFESYLLELGKRQKLQEKLRRTIMKELKEQQAFTPMILDTPLLNRITLEILRLHPLVSLVRGHARRDLSISEGGYSAPLRAGTPIIFPISSYGRDQDIFPEPDEVLPSRFKGSQGFKEDKIFLGGEFTQGEELIMMIAQTSIVRILVRFQLTREGERMIFSSRS